MEKVQKNPNAKSEKRIGEKTARGTRPSQKNTPGVIERGIENKTTLNH